MAETIGKSVSVLDDGFVQLVDVMGNDAAIVQAARVSYGAGTKTVSDDRGLIRYLMRHRHTSPFEMCELKFLIRIPMDAWRQHIRHRTANVNEYSTRYSEAIDSRQRTKPGEWRMQATDKWYIHRRIEQMEGRAPKASRLHMGAAASASQRRGAAGSDERCESTAHDGRSAVSC